MTDLYIIFGLVILVNAAVLYLSIGLLLVECVKIYLPFIKKMRIVMGIEEEKNTPKDPIWHTQVCPERTCGFFEWKTCPACGETLIYFDQCHKCGQKIKTNNPTVVKV